MLSIRVFGEDITKPHHATLRPEQTEEQPQEPTTEASEKDEQAAAPTEEDEEAALNV